MKKVLITGATGFIGLHAIPALKARGYDIHAISRNKPAAASKADAHWLNVDLMDHSAIRSVIEELRPTHLLHFAWTMEHRLFWSTPDNLSWVAASLEILRSFAENGGRRFVGAGTCAEYEWNGEICHERQTPLRPATVYGTCKKAFHDILGAYAHGTGLSWAWGRIFFLFGPDEPPGRFVPYLIQNCLRKQPAVCQFGQLERDFLPVQAVADAFVALMSSDVVGSVNIASGQKRSLGEIAASIARCCGDSGRVEIRQDVPAATEPLRLGADVTRLRDEVGWQPPVSMEPALESTVQWWRKTLENGQANAPR